MNCRFCSHTLTHVFVDLGQSPPSNSFLNKDQLNLPEAVFPLKVYVCEKCFLVQIDEFKKSDTIFNDEYVYFSSYSHSWLEHAKRYVNSIIPYAQLSEKSRVIEVASNDGYLLQYFVQKGIPVLGIEPTANTARVAIEKGVNTRIEFMTEKFGRQLADEGLKADLVLGNNVLAHVPDIVDFVKGLKAVLKENGVITMEFPHLFQLVKNNQFDTIYHEHFSYLSLISVSAIFKSAGLKLIDAEELPTHGGSLRIYAVHKENNSWTESNRLSNVIDLEMKAGMNKSEYYTHFQEKVLGVKKAFINFVVTQNKLGKKIAGYGAAAKGNTLLNFSDLKSDSVLFVADANPNKQGKFLPGSHIPVVNEEVIKIKKPDYIIIFPWNIKEEIMNQLSYIRDWNGKFVVAVPELLIF